MKGPGTWAIFVTLALELGCASKRPFGSMRIAVKTSWEVSPAERVVRVELWNEGCFVAPPELRVRLNGEVLPLLYGGKTLSPSTILGLIPRCEPVLYQSRPFGPGMPAIRERVDIELGRAHGYVEIEGLRASRAPGIVSGGLTPGKETSLEWLPRTDVWPERHFEEDVRFEGSDGARLTVQGSDLRVEDGWFRFVMPVIHPGSVAVSLSAGPAGPLARVATCHGFIECLTTEFGVTTSVRMQVNPPAGPRDE